MRDRLQKILTSEGIAPTRFAEIIGVQRSSISHILSGRNKPSFDMVQSILDKFPKLNPDWVMLGKGDMYRKVIQTSLFDSQAISKSEPSVEKLSQESSVAASPINESKAPENPISERKVERVVIFYNDKTFTDYRPE